MFGNPINVQKSAAKASAERQAFRAALYKRTSLVFFEALLERDAHSVVAKLRQLQNAFSRFREPTHFVFKQRLNH